MERFERDGLVFDVTDGGPPEGEAVVLLHGFPQDRTAWDAVTPLLQAQGLRTLAPDQRGYSPGARPRGRAAYRMSECARDVVALLDAAGVERAHIVGHDWGGGAAWAFATRYPDRTRSLVVLSTPHPAAMAWAFTHSRQALTSWYMAFFQLPWLPERLVPRTLAATLSRSGLPPDHVRRYVDRMREPGALAGALGWYRGMPATMRAGSGGATHRVKVPTTYVWGRKDFALGRAAAEKTADFVTGPYRFVELDAGHWLPENEPGPVAGAILDQVHAAAG